MKYNSVQGHNTFVLMFLQRLSYGENSYVFPYLLPIMSFLVSCYRSIPLFLILFFLSCTPKVLNITEVVLPHELSIKPICAIKLLQDIDTEKPMNEPVAKTIGRMRDEEFCALFTAKEIKDLIFAFEAEIDRWGYELVPYPEGGVIIPELERGNFGLRFRALLRSGNRSNHFINYFQSNNYQRVRFGDIVYQAFERLNG